MKYICTSCGEEIPEKNINESVYKTHPINISYYKFVMGVLPACISKFKFLHHKSGVDSCGPVKRVNWK